MPPDTLTDRLDRYCRFGVKLGLANIRACAAALGHPERGAPAIHVGGTNGKGSTTAAISAILRAANYPAGRYTSPHLSDVTERIAIDEVPITAAALERALDAVDRAAEQAGCQALTYFEALTAAAFTVFQKRRVDVAVYEVGLGGRLDATNIIEPELTCVTTVAHDHVVHLGESLGQIAGEKAGIIKPGVPVVCGPMPPEAQEVLRLAAAEAEAPLRAYGVDFGLRGDPDATAEGWQSAVWWGRRHDDLPFRIPVSGRWQAENAACALAVVHELIGRGWNIKPAAIRSGLESLRWPGRMEWLRRAPAVLFDSAHNPAAVHAAVATVQAACPGGVLPVFAVLADKDVEGMARALAPLGPQVVVAASDHPRALATEALAEIAARHFATVHVAPGIESAVDSAARLAPDRPAFVTGSMMNYTAARAALAPSRTAPA